LAKQLLAIKYDSQGNELWVARYEDSGELIDLAVDSGGNIILTGASSPYGGDYLTVKYDPDGNEVWAVEYDGQFEDPATGGGHDQPSALAVDSAGNVYVTGASVSSSGLGCFGPNTPACELTAGEPVPYNPYPAAAGGDYHADCAYATYDFATVKYGPDGNLLWVARYAGFLDLPWWDEQPTDLAVDAAGNVYVTGYRSWMWMLLHEIVTVKYSPFGTELWRVAYDGPAFCTDEATSIAVNHAGDVFVAGGSIGIGTRKDYVTIKYSESAFYIWTVPASAEAAGPGHQGATASSRFGVIFAFFSPLLALALLRRRLLKSR